MHYSKPISNSLNPISKSGKHRWIEKWRNFAGVFALNLATMMLVGTMVIYHFTAPPLPEIMTFTKVKAPPPPPKPPAAGGQAQRSSLEVAPVVAPPPVSLPSIVTSLSATPSNFKTTIPTMAVSSLPSFQMPVGTGLSTGSSGGTGVQSNPFGDSGSDGTPALVGYFYDLKQSPDHQPNRMDADIEQSVLRDFFKGGWDEDAFATNYLKSPTPLSTNEILVPIQYSSQGPKAFHMGSICQPGYWVVIYHINVTPSHDGDYQLAGFGDDFLVARVDGGIALDSGYYPPVTPFKAVSYIPPVWYAPYTDPSRTWEKNYGRLAVGRTFHFSAGVPVSIDVLMGDANPAGGQGLCGYFLFLLQAGKDYAKDSAGASILPLLQIQPQSVERTGKYPPYTSNAEDALIQ